MSNSPFKITVDSHEYMVTAQRDGDVITVYDIEGALVADAERDSMSESVLFDYYDVESGRLEDFSGDLPDLYQKTSEEIAIWLVSTYPGV